MDSLETSKVSFINFIKVLMMIQYTNLTIFHFILLGRVLKNKKNKDVCNYLNVALKKTFPVVVEK